MQVLVIQRLMIFRHIHLLKDVNVRAISYQNNIRYQSTFSTCCRYYKTLLVGIIFKDVRYFSYLTILKIIMQISIKIQISKRISSNIIKSTMFKKIKYCFKFLRDTINYVHVCSLYGFFKFLHIKMFNTLIQEYLFI